MKAMIASIKNIDGECIDEYSLVTFNERHNRIRIATFGKYHTKIVSYELERGTFMIPKVESDTPIIRRITKRELESMLKYAVKNRQRFKL